MSYSDSNTATSEEDLPPLASHKAGHSPLPEEESDKKGTKNKPGPPKFLFFLLVLAVVAGAAGYLIYGKHQPHPFAQIKSSAVTPAPVRHDSATAENSPDNPNATLTSPVASPSVVPESTPALLIRPQIPIEPSSTPEPAKSETEMAQLYHGKTAGEPVPSPSATPLSTPLPNPNTSLLTAPQTSPSPSSSTALSASSPAAISTPAQGKTTFPGLTATTDNASIPNSQATAVTSPTPAPSSAPSTAPNPAPASTPAPNASIIAQNYEETSLNMQQVDVALFPKSTELPPQTLHLNVPIVHEKRLLSFTVSDIAEFNNLVTRIQDTRSKQVALQKEMQAELAEYNTLIQRGTPEAILNADSPSLISNTNSQAP
jgi:hypothetical protein